MPSSSHLPSSAHAGGSFTSENELNDAAFACSICLEGVKDREPVVTQCGHLYCWPCLYRWLHIRSQSAELTCPVCKAGVTQENVIPIFIRDSQGGSNKSSEKRKVRQMRPVQRTNPITGVVETVQEEVEVEVEVDTERGVPNRPQARRLEPVAGPMHQTFNGMGAPGTGASLTSTGFFPSLFGLQFQSFTNYGRERSARVNNPPADNGEGVVNNPMTAGTGGGTEGQNAVYDVDSDEKAYLNRTLYILLAAVFICLFVF